MKKNNILFLFWGQTGGGARYSMEMAKALKDQGINFYSSLSYSNAFFEETNSLSSGTCNIKTYSNKLEFLTSSLLLPLKLIKLFKFIRAMKISTIYIPMRQHWTFILLYLFKRSKVKVVFTCHDPYLHSGEENKLLNMILRYESKCCDTLIVLTNTVRDIAVTDFKIPEANITVIPHASFFQNNEKTFNTGESFQKRNILFFGRILEYKGLDIFLKACLILQENGFNITPSIYGNGDIEPYSDLIDKLKHVKVENRWINEDEIVPTFLENSLLILPYKDASQSGPLTIALGLGMPPIVTPVSGLQEQVINLETGLVCEEVNEQSVAKAIKKALSDYSFYQSLSNNAYNFALKELSWSKSAKVLEQEFNSLY